MTEAINEEKASSKNEQWRERIAEQEGSGLSVKQFCKERGLTECSFYAWRKRLRKKEAVRFALVERATPHECANEALLEVVLASGERLRIGAGVDTATLRSVLDVLRA